MINFAVRYAEAALPAITVRAMAGTSPTFDDGQITRHHIQHVEQLAFVFVDALDLHVKEAVGRDGDAGALTDGFGQPIFVSR